MNPDGRSDISLALDMDHCAVRKTGQSRVRLNDRASDSRVVKKTRSRAENRVNIVLKSNR